MLFHSEERVKFFTKIKWAEYFKPKDRKQGRTGDEIGDRMRMERNMGMEIGSSFGRTGRYE